MSRVKTRIKILKMNQNWILRISSTPYGRKIIRLRRRDRKRERQKKKMTMFLILRINGKDLLMYRHICIHFFLFLPLPALLLCTLCFTNSPLIIASLAAVLICLNRSGPKWVPPNHLLTTTITFHASII